MTPTHKLRQVCRLEVPKFNANVGPEAEFTTLYPRIISSSLSRTSHVEADELTVKLDWQSGVDVRLLKNARIAYYLWDSNEEDFDQDKHLRFAGVAYDAKRTGSESDVSIELTFHDYTTLFLEAPMGSIGVPDWSDTLQSAWERLCDSTGWFDPESNEIVSSVSALRSRLVFRLANDELRTMTLGSAVPERFHKISKPTPPPNATSWAAWQWCVSALGLISFIDRDQCIVTDTASFFSEENAPAAIWGENITTISETASARTSAKGILLKSFDPLRGLALESFYPPLGDPRAASAVKTKRANASKRAISENDLAAAHYVEQHAWFITDQAALDVAAKSVFEQWSRQSCEGSFTTAVTALDVHADVGTGEERPTGSRVSIFDLKPGDAIGVSFRDLSPDFLVSLGGEEEQVRHLVDRMAYSEDVARLIVQNSAGMLKLRPVFNVRGLSVELDATSYKATVRYWNRIR